MNTNKVALFCTMVLVLWVILPATSMAAIIYSSFGAGDSYNGTTGVAEAGTSTTANQIVALEFTNSTGEDMYLTQIDLADSFVSGDNSMILNLYANNAGVPGTVLESWVVSSLPDLGTCCTVETVHDSAGVVLSNGASYFLAPVPDSTTVEAWNWNSIGASGLDAFSTDGGVTWTAHPIAITGAFDVLGTPTPEPPDALLVGAGMFGMIALRALGCTGGSKPPMRADQRLYAFNS